MPRLDFVRAALFEAGMDKKRERINHELVDQVDFALHPPKPKGIQFSSSWSLARIRLKP